MRFISKFLVFGIHRGWILYGLTACSAHFYQWLCPRILMKGKTNNSNEINKKQKQNTVVHGVVSTG